MTDHSFRFGVVGAAQDGAAEWRQLAQRVEDLGYTTLLSPDGLQLLSPLPALAVAASVTKRLRVGTFVMASPLRAPRIAAWEAHSMSVLLDGRFELGIGTGHPGVVKQATEILGETDVSGARRLALLDQTVDYLRELDGDAHTPVMIAASGPKARAVAAAKADIVTLPTGPLASREEAAQLTAELRAAAGDRADEIELAMNLFVVGEVVPPWIEQFIGADAATLIENDSLTMVRGTPRQIADELLRRRESIGVSYISVNVAFHEELAPVVEILDGK